MISCTNLDLETARLQALYEMNIIGSSANDVFQQITEQAASLSDADFACIKLLDKNHSWVFTHTGTGKEEIPREFSLCAKTIEHGQDILKLDLKKDLCFAHNPLLQAHPGLRFYLGITLYSPEGFALGCLSVMSTSDFLLHQKHENSLLALAREASRQIEFFYSSTKRDNTQSILSYLAIASDAILVTEEDGTIMLVNSAAEGLLGASRKELLGAPLECLFSEEFRYLHAEQRTVFRENPHPRDMIKSKPTEVAFTNFRGERLYVKVSLTPLHATGKILNVATLHDVTDYIATRRMLDKINTSETAEIHNKNFFESLGYSLAEETGASYITIGELDARKKVVRSLVFLEHNTLQDNFSYDLHGTPCETTIKDHSCVVTHDLQSAYPDDPIIGEMNLQGYVGLRLYASNGEVYGLINALFDYPITHKQATQVLNLLEVVALRAAPELERIGNEQTLAKLSASVENSPNAVVITDCNSIIEYINPSYTNMTGFSQYDCIGHKVTLNSSGNTPQQVYSKMWQEIHAGRVWEGDLENRKKDGTLYWARTKIFSIRNTREEIIHLVGIQEDISHHKYLNEKLEYDATHDQLTNLYNRREFERHLEAAMSSARKEDKVHALCFLDLDHFKVLNDTSGHHAGDILLVKISEILKKSIRAHDTAARLGGDEFALLLLACSIEQAGKVAEKIREAICAINFVWEGRANSVGVSIGITEITGAINDKIEILKRVDAACYMAKEKGRNRISLYREDSEAIYQHRQEIDWVPRIRTAITNDRFELYVQAVMYLDQGTCEQACYHEVLLRLKEGDELVSPGRFLPAIERYHLSVDLDRYVINKAFRWIEENPDLMDNFCGLGLNLSGASVSDPSLLEFIIAKLEEELVPAQKIKFEITETAAITDIVEVSQFMKRIRDVGSQVVLDDFGSGLSSFPYLRNLPIDILKIDGMMVREIAHDKSSRIMVKMINEMAHSLGYHTVAEYVEDEAILACLQELKVDCVQGYGIAMPVPLASISGSDNT